MRYINPRYLLTYLLGQGCEGAVRARAEDPVDVLTRTNLVVLWLFCV